MTTRPPRLEPEPGSQLDRSGLDLDRLSGPLNESHKGNASQERPGEALAHSADRLVPDVAPGPVALMNPDGKSGEKSRRPGTFQPGYDPRRGHGPAPGAPNAGRPRDEDLEWLASVSVKDPKVRERLGAILEHGDPELFRKVFQWAFEVLHGRPGQSVDLTSGGQPTLLLGPLPPAEDEPQE